MSERVERLKGKVNRMLETVNEERKVKYSPDMNDNDDWIGPFINYDDARRFIDKKLRDEKVKARDCSYSILLKGDGVSAWVNVGSMKTIKGMIQKYLNQFSRYRNCLIDSIVYIKAYVYAHDGGIGFSVWPGEKTDYSLNKDNNWGEEE